MSKMNQFSEVHIPDQSKLRYYQKECIDKIEEARLKGGSHLVVLPTGAGKCFAPGTKVLMYDGSIRKIETIKEGEQVMGPDSTPRTVIGLSHGFEMMYKISPTKGEPYIVNESHILSLKATGNKGNTCDIYGNRYAPGNICNISVKDYLQCSKTFKHCMKGYRTEVNFSKKDVILEPYLLGLWLGDGTSIYDTLTIANFDTEIIDYLNEYAYQNNYLLSTHKQKGNCVGYHFKAKKQTWYGTKLRLAIKEYDLRNNKHIPIDYLTNNLNNRLELLAGLLDTDGYYHNGYYEIVTKFEQLNQDILYLSRSCGFAAYSAIKEVKGKKYYRISISGDVCKIPCKLKRKQAKSRKQKKNVLNVGIKVESIGEGEYYGFELIGPDRLFLLADFTVVHNTFTFTSIPRYGRVLILSHRDELVHQPERYYKNQKVYDRNGNLLPECTFGVEQASEHSNGEEVISASVQSLIRRLDKFDPEYFDTIIIDEAHHAPAQSYRKIINHFKPNLLLGFTATPDRNDKVDLHEIFDDIIYMKDMRWGIEEGFLTDIECFQVNTGYNLDDVKIQMGDFHQPTLAAKMMEDDVMENTIKAYNELRKGQTIIFAVNVEHAYKLQERIPRSVVVEANTPNRDKIFADFTARKFDCLINVFVVTEGTDLPLIETVMMVRPTKNLSLYCLDMETEILTKDGWKHEHEVNMNDQIAAFDTSSSEIRFVPIKNKIKRKLNENDHFYSFSNNHCDIRVTNNHRMVYRNKGQKEWYIKTVDEIAKRTSGSYIPVSGYCNYKDIPLSDDEIRFIAWVMTDGCINKANNVITISQSDTQPWCNDISKTIENCGMKYSKRIYNSKTNFKRNGNNIIWTISKGQPRGKDSHLKGWGYLEDYISKDFSPNLMKMSDRQFEIFLNTVNLADGSKQKKEYNSHGSNWKRQSLNITKGNKKFIDNLQTLCILHGYRANISERKNPSGNSSYNIYIKKQEYTNIGQTYNDRPGWNEEPHTDEFCWCVEDELGTIVTRRNGKVTIMGNCQCLGRGLRPAPGKDVCRLIDCVGVSKRKLATVGTLFGVDEAKMPEKDKDKLQGIRLTKMEGVIEAALDTPEFWISNKKQKLFESDNEVSLRYLNFVPLANDTLVLSLPNFEIKIPPIDALGNTKAIFVVKKPDGSYGKPQISPEGSLQETIDRVHSMLTVKMVDSRILWDKRLIERTWGKAPASDKQKNYIRRLAEINHVDLSGVNIDELTKHQAGIIIERINQNEKLKAESKPKSYSPYQKGKIRCQTNYK